SRLCWQRSCPKAGRFGHNRHRHGRRLHTWRARPPRRVLPHDRSPTISPPAAAELLGHLSHPLLREGHVFVAGNLAGIFLTLAARLREAVPALRRECADDALERLDSASDGIGLEG